MNRAAHCDFQKYHDLQAQDQVRYRREYLQVYGKEAPSA